MDADGSHDPYSNPPELHFGSVVLCCTGAWLCLGHSSGRDVEAKTAGFDSHKLFIPKAG